MANNTENCESKRTLKSWFESLRNTELSSEDVLKIYSELVETTDYNSIALEGGFEAPAITVKYFCDGFPPEQKSTAKILDVGAGTGLVARGLRTQGFHHIDALDASEAMLSIAKKDNLYENYICEYISDKKLSIASDTYDGLTSSASIAVSHIPCEALHEMIRIVKPGGLIVIVGKEGHADNLPQYKGRLVPLMRSLEEQGKWKKLLEENGLPYCKDETATVWKYQVMKNGNNSVATEGIFGRGYKTFFVLNSA